MGVFDKFIPAVWPYTFRGRIHVDELHGGVPSDLTTVTNWLKTRVEGSSDGVLADEIAKAAAQIVEERGISVPTDSDAVGIADEAIEKVAKATGLSGFKRDPERGLYIMGYQLKAALKEAVNVSVAAGKIDGKKWGLTGKGSAGFVAEHIQILEDRLYLETAGTHEPITEPTNVSTRPVHLWNGTALTQEEFVEGAEFDFTLITDWDFPDEFWAIMWLTGQYQGLGASRSMSFGRYEVTEWERVPNDVKPLKVSNARPAAKKTKAAVEATD
jgi:hypothetical protein